MKKFTFLFMVLSFTLIFAACNNTSDTSIAGDWEMIYENTELILTFNSDNTYKLITKAKNQEIENGTYENGKAGMFTMESTDKSHILDGNYQMDTMIIGDRNNPESNFELNRVK